MKKALMCIVAVCFFSLWAISGAFAAETVNEINFGVIPTESSSSMQKGFEPFRADMQKALGIPVNIYFAPDYAGVIEAMRFNKIQIAWFGNKSAIEAVKRASGEVFAQTTDATGNLGYWSLIIVHKDSPLKSIDDIIQRGKNLTFGNGDPNSTSGYLIPSYYIWGKNNIDPRKYFKKVRNANHETNCLAIATKQIDFATNNTESLSRFQKAKPEMAKNIRYIWKSPLIPNDPLVWRKDLPREIKSKIKAFILSYGRIGSNKDHQLEVLKGLSSGWGPFLESSNHQLLPIMEINFVKNQLKIENNDNLSSNEKIRRATKIKKELANLKTYCKLMKEFN